MKWIFFILMTSYSDMKRLGINVYNQKSIPMLQQTVEHIIPKSLFINRKHANQWNNLISCDKYTNIIRSDYRLGDPLIYNDLFLEYEELQNKSRQCLITVSPQKPYKLVMDSTGHCSGVLDRIQRIFYPSTQADMGLISRSIIEMLHKYPYLYNSLDRIVYHPQLLDAYYNKPKSELELAREQMFIENF